MNKTNLSLILSALGVAIGTVSLLITVLGPITGLVVAAYVAGLITGLHPAPPRPALNERDAESII